MQKGNDEGRHGQRWEAFLAAALIATSLGASATGDVMPKAHAEQSVVEKRRAEANKRKELLSRAYVSSSLFPDEQGYEFHCLLLPGRPN